jgi:predicted small secreted protein
MLTRIMLMVAALAVGSMTLSACNTVGGAGRDIERAGQKVQSEAAEHKKY